MPRLPATGRRRIANMPYALSFNGSQHVALDTMGDLGSSLSGAFSYGIWVKTNSQLTTVQYYLGESSSGSGCYLLCGITRNSSNVGYVNFQLRDHTGLHSLGVQVSGRRINDGQWHLINGTKDATNTVAGMKMYIDRVSQTLTTIASTGLADGMIDFNRNMAIGSGLGQGAVTTAWVGKLSRPYFYKRELTQTEIDSWFYNRTPPTGEFAGYENTAGAGTSVVDTQGAHNGTLTSAGQWTSTDVPYRSRNARVL